MRKHKAWAGIHTKSIMHSSTEVKATSQATLKQVMSGFVWAFIVQEKSPSLAF